MNPIVPWIGGKRRLANKIFERFPEHKCYVEAFAGAAAMYFLKQPSKVEVLNDINGDLINLYRVVQHHLEEFARQFKWALSSRQMFEWEKMKAPETLTDIQRAARFFYLQKLAFGARVDGQSYGTATTCKPRLNLLRIEEDLSAAHLRLSATNIEHLPWRECVKKYDRAHTLTFLDPPYWGTEGYGVEFGLAEYSAIAEFADTSKGAVVITVNDIPEMREIFGHLHTDTMAILYTVGGGKGHRARELLIWNQHAADRTSQDSIIRRRSVKLSSPSTRTASSRSKKTK